MAQPKARSDSQQTLPDERRSAALSQRELEIVSWIATGKSDWDISQILGISPKTVNYHVEKVKKNMPSAHGCRRLSQS